MLYVIDKGFNEIDFIGRVVNFRVEDGTYIISDFETLYGDPIVGKINNDLYRSRHSVKQDREWVDAIFTYYIK